MAKPKKKSPAKRRLPARPRTSAEGERQGRGRQVATEKVLLVLRRVLSQLPPRAFKGQASLVKDLGVDSLKVAELSIALEDAFDKPVFLGEVFAHVEDPTSLTVEQLAEFLASSGEST
jgi:acyl carrier protein